MASNTENTGRPGRFSRWLKGAKGRSAWIALVYMLAGSAWIVLSDHCAMEHSKDTLGVFQLSVVKGLVYVAVSALLIFFLVHGALDRVFRSQQMYKGLSEAYRDRQALLESLIHSIPDQIYYKDRQRKYMGCNSAFCAFAGRSERQILGLRDEDFLSGDPLRASVRSDAECLTEGAMQRYEEVVVQGGETRCFETIKTPWLGADGSAIGLIGVSRDVTARRSASCT